MIRKFFLRFWRTLRSAFFLKCTVVVNLLVYLVCCFFLSKRDYLFLKDIYFHFFKYFAFETASQIWCRHFSWWLPPPRKNVMDAVDLKKWCVDYAKMYVCNSNFLMPLVFCCCQSSIIQLYSFIFSSLRLCVCVSRSAGSITIEKTIFFFLFPTVCDPFINRTYLYTQQMEKRDFFFLVIIGRQIVLGFLLWVFRKGHVHFQDGWLIRLAIPQRSLYVTFYCVYWHKRIQIEMDWWRQISLLIQFDTFSFFFLTWPGWISSIPPSVIIFTNVIVCVRTETPAKFLELIQPFRLISHEIWCSFTSQGRLFLIWV